MHISVYGLFTEWKCFCFLFFLFFAFIVYNLGIMNINAYFKYFITECNGLILLLKEPVY